MLHILYGSSVSDKQERLYDEVIRLSEENPGKNYIYIVPEQASLIVQKALIDRHPKHALFNIDVLTFSRLMHRVFGDLNIQEKDMLSETGKRMLMRLTAEKKAGELRLLRRNIHKPGFADEMKSVVSEFAEYNVTPEMLLKKAEELQRYPLLQAKLYDIGILYGAFVEQLHEHYEMAEERLLKLRDVLPSWAAVGATVFIFDGFTGFTPLQYEVTRVMIRCASDVIANVTVGRDETLGEHAEKEDLFYMGNRMASLLKEQAITEGVDYDETKVTTEKMTGGAIRFIEKQLFNYPKKIYHEKTADVRLLKCRNRKEEVKAALSEVLATIRAGYAYREIAVIAGDPKGMREEIEARFSEAGVPFFIDAGADLENDPYIALIRNTLSVLENNYAYESVIAFLKNPIVTAFLETKFEQEASAYSVYERLCLAENFAFSRNLRGRSRWQSYDNVYVAAALEPIYELQDAWKNETAAARTDAFRTFLAVYDCGSFLRTAAAKEEAEEHFAEARSLLHSEEAVAALFDEICVILGDMPLSRDLFSDVLSEGLASLKTGLIPPTVDRLVIGDLMRTRLYGIKKLIVIGANDGVLPAAGDSGGLLTDLDREILSSNQLQLSETCREESFNAQFYLYLLLTLPSESVCMTYAAADTSGKPLLPAHVFTFLRSMFPSAYGEFDSVQSVCTRSEVEEELASRLRIYKENGQADDALRTLSVWYGMKPENAAGYGRMTAALNYRYREELLSDEVIRRMFNETMTGSVTRLERFAECAFKHFLTYGLGLKQRKEYEVGAVDYGILFHDSISVFFRKAEERGIDFGTMTEEERDSLITEAVSEVTAEYGEQVLSDTKRNAYIATRVERIAKRTVETLAAQWAEGQFTGTASEVKFLFDGFEGRIDRMDTADDGERTYVRIIDYKSSDRDLNFTKIYYGLQLQLLLYMEAAKDILKKRRPDREIVPAGVYYYRIDDPLVDGSPEDSDETVRAGILDKLKMKGITNADDTAAALVDREIGGRVVTGLKKGKDGAYTKGAKVAETADLNALSAYARDKAQDLKERIRSGKIPVKPYEYGKENGCAYCEYRGICGFNRAVPGYSAVRLTEKTLEDMTERGERRGI